MFENQLIKLFILDNDSMISEKIKREYCFWVYLVNTIY